MKPLVEEKAIELEHENTMKKVLSTYEEHKFRKWYLGTSTLTTSYPFVPNPDSEYYFLDTYSTHGSACTPHYGEVCDMDNFQQDLFYEYMRYSSYSSTIQTYH